MDGLKLVNSLLITAELWRSTKLALNAWERLARPSAKDSDVENVTFLALFPPTANPLN